jgi:hypothetical protein
VKIHGCAAMTEPTPSPIGPDSGMRAERSAAEGLGEVDARQSRSRGAQTEFRAPGRTPESLRDLGPANICRVDSRHVRRGPS